MLIVKITIFLIVITAIFTFLSIAYVAGNPMELFKLKFDKDCLPWYLRVNEILVIMSILGIVLSVIYLLF